jgi:hypothetical protein
MRIIPSRIVALNQHRRGFPPSPPFANHKCILPIYCLTVVSLCILLNLHHLSSHIVAVRRLESPSRENYFPLLNPLDLPSSIVMFSLSNSSLVFCHHPLRILASTSVAKHRSVLPIFSLTVVSTWSYSLQGAVDFKSFYCVISRALRFYVVLLKFAVLPGVILVQIQDNYHLRRQRGERSFHIRCDCSVALFGRLFVSLSAVVLCQKECIMLRASRELSHSQFIVNSQTIHRQAFHASLS